MATSQSEQEGAHTETLAGAAECQRPIVRIAGWRTGRSCTLKLQGDGVRRVRGPRSEGSQIIDDAQLVFLTDRQKCLERVKVDGFHQVSLKPAARERWRSPSWA